MRIYQRTAVLLTVGALLGGLLPAGAALAASPPTKPAASGVVFFAADGMRPDLMEKYAAQGVMPTYAKLMANGVKGDNGLVQAFPPNTGVGWYTLATGAYPGEHGSTNNTFFRTGDSVQQPHRRLLGGRAPGRHDRRGGRAGRQEGRLGRVGRRLANDDGRCKGPVVDYRNFYSNRGLWTNWDVPGQPAGATAFGVAVPALRPGRRGGLDQRPRQLQPGQAGHLRHRRPTRAARRPSRSSPTTSTTSTSTTRPTTR